jgi:uncharacterized protein YicC (UPF0701 family)
MRRLFVTTALAAALFGAAACTASPTNTASDTPSSAAPTASLKDRKASCADFKAGSEAASVKLLAAMGEALKVMENPDKAEEIMTKLLADLKVALADMRGIAEKEAATAGDAELKAQLVIVAAEMKKVEAELAKVSPKTSFGDLPEMDTAAGSAATDKIEELCK